MSVELLGKGTRVTFTMWGPSSGLRQHVQARERGASMITFGLYSGLGLQLSVLALKSGALALRPEGFGSELLGFSF